MVSSDRRRPSGVLGRGRRIAVIRPGIHADVGRAALLACAATVLTAMRTEAAAAPPPASAAVASIASINKQVETRHTSEEGWALSKLSEPLFGHDGVRTGAASRAEIRFFSDGTVLRLDQKSELEITPATADQPGLLRLITGNHYFSGRAPKEFRRIETPTVTAYVKGTEFVVAIAEDTTTTITMLEGVLEARNSYGALSVQRGEQAYVEPGKAPVKRIVVRPREAVAWALYYPPVLGGGDAERLRGLGKDGEDLARAASLLSAGQVGEARPLIEAVRGRQPGNPVALALSSVVRLAANEKEEALRLAEDAAAADPGSAAAVLALSFAAQASFDIARARASAERAAELDPQSSVALARAAELRMAEGDLAGARRAAGSALERTPDDGRALAVLGFVDLAQLRTAEATAAFEKAVSADSGLSLAHLGLGIARIRSGDVDKGREELQIAAGLDPDDSLLRSYLAKAYYEERRTDEAGKELEVAKELDPRDPTPYLYDAIRKQNENRPVEALADLEASIARNDNRAVYRSRLLLDQDRAVRGSDLARIYNDLGFEQLGLVTARRSADQDQANYSSHLFLAGNYRTVPGFAPAFLSEILQARIYQPVSVNAARPDVVNGTVSFNEYTALFDRPRARAFGGLTYGSTADLSDQFVTEDVSITDSDIRTSQLVGTVNGDRFAVALGYSKASDDGFRFNSDQSTVNYRGFFEYSPTDHDSFQLNALHSLRATGDLPLRGNVTGYKGERFGTEITNGGLGYHRTVSPGTDLAVSAIYSVIRQTTRMFACPKGTEAECVPVFFELKQCRAGASDCEPCVAGEPCEVFRVFPKATARLEGPQVEVQQVSRQNATTWILGAGTFQGQVHLRQTGLFRRMPLPPAELKSDDEFTNAYLYVTLRQLQPVEITLGAVGERVVSPAGLFVPRDSQIGGTDLQFSKTDVSPKLGVSVYLPHRTTLRTAFYYRLSPEIGRLQTLEPTQVAGFNQFFDEPGGTRSLSYGAGLDQEIAPHLYGGLSILRRRLEIPQPFCRHPAPLYACANMKAEILDERRNRDALDSAYLNAAIGKRITAGVEYNGERRRIGTTMVLPGTSQLERSITTRRIRPQVRVFLPAGFFAVAKATYYSQVVMNDEPPGNKPARFWLGDLQVGYRLLRRYGSVVLEAHNLSLNKDEPFTFYERSPEETVAPARSVSLSANLTF